MQHKFAYAGEFRYPRVGELIKNGDTGNFINIVLGVSEEHTDDNGSFVYIRSVRYGKTNGGNFKLLNGKRSRSFKWYSKWASYNPCTWYIVDEFVKYDNTAIREHILYLMKDVKTSYTPPEEEEEEDV